MIIIKTPSVKKTAGFFFAAGIAWYALFSFYCSYFTSQQPIQSPSQQPAIRHNITFVTSVRWTPTTNRPVVGVEPLVIFAPLNHSAIPPNPQKTIVLESESYPLQPYQSRIKCPFSCSTAIALGFSKFAWLNLTMHLNPFDTEYFAWIDPHIEVPHSSSLNLSLGKFLFFNKAFFHLKRNETPRPTFMGSFNSPFHGGLFGGHHLALKLVIVEEGLSFFLRNLIPSRRVDNEEIFLSFAYQQRPEMVVLLQHSQFKRGQCGEVCL